MAILTKPQISPSILSADFSRLGEQIAAVQDSGCKVLHLDVMDGCYVPNISFGPLVVEAVRRITTLELESHLMIMDPDKYIEAFVQAGSDIILVHPGTCPSVDDTLRKIHAQGVRAGLVINPDEDVNLVAPYLDQLDQVLVMSVYPGFGGQKFMPSVLEGIKQILPELEAHNILLEIDGGVNSRTIPMLSGLGIDRYVAGSAVFNNRASPAENYQALLEQIQ